MRHSARPGRPARSVAIFAFIQLLDLNSRAHPQGFPRELLERAYRDASAAGITATDDAALVERLGEPVVLVRGDELALKVTEPGDFARAELLSGLLDGNDARQRQRKDR